jgi:broad specificity phosphatase PhoE
MPRLYLVRHCEPSITGVMLGQCDPPLSEAGREHASQLLRDIDLEIVYSSPLRRALETAQAIARTAPIEILDDLKEISYGDWDGLTWAQIEARDPDLARRKYENWTSITPPGGEPWTDFETRVRRAFEQIVRGTRPAAIVAHAAVNHLIGAPQQAYGDVYEL